MIKLYCYCELLIFTKLITPAACLLCVFYLEDGVVMVQNYHQDSYLSQIHVTLSANSL